MNSPNSNAKQSISAKLRQQNMSFDSILSTVKIKNNPYETMNSFQGSSSGDQNSTYLPESPYLRNSCVNSMSQSQSRFINTSHYEQTLQNKIIKIKQQLSNKIVTNSGQNTIQSRLEALKQTINTQNLNVNGHVALENQASNQKNRRYSNSPNTKKKYLMNNKSVGLSSQNCLKSNKESLVNIPPFIQFNTNLPNPNSKYPSFIDNKVVGDCHEGYEAYILSIYEKKRAEFCTAFFENMQLDAERQFKANADKTKSVQQILESNCELMGKTLSELFEILSQAIISSKNITLLDEKLTYCITKSTNLKISYLMLVFYKLLGKISYFYNDFLKCVKLLKLCKNYSQFYGVQSFKTNCYKYIGLAYQRLSKPKVALAYFTKMLRQSWLLKLEDQEINSYDLIGMCYFYLGNIEKAQKFHHMMINGIKGDEEVMKISTSMIKNRKFSNYPTLMNMRVKQDDSNEGGSNMSKTIKKSKIINQQYQLSQAEWNEYISSSEDEFELPQAQNSSQNLTEKSFKQKILSIPWNDRFIKAQIHKLEIAQESSYNKNPIGLIFKNLSTPIEKSSGPKPLLVVGPHASKQYNQSLHNAYSSRLRMSHKTPNREFFNYHSLVQQTMEQKQINQVQKQYDVMVESIELTHHLLVVKNIKKVRDQIKNLIPFLRVKLTEMKLQGSPSYKEMNQYGHKDKFNSNNSPYLLSPQQKNNDQSFYKDQKANSSQKSSNFQMYKANQKQNIFQTLFKAKQPSAHQATQQLNKQQQLLQVILNQNHPKTEYQKERDKSHYLDITQSQTKSPIQNLKSKQEDTINMSNFMLIKTQSSQKSKTFYSLNNSRKQSQIL